MLTNLHRLKICTHTLITKRYLIICTLHATHTIIQNTYKIYTQSVATCRFLPPSVYLTRTPLPLATPFLLRNRRDVSSAQRVNALCDIYVRGCVQTWDTSIIVTAVRRHQTINQLAAQRRIHRHLTESLLQHALYTTNPRHSITTCQQLRFSSLDSISNGRWWVQLGDMIRAATKYVNELTSAVNPHFLGKRALQTMHTSLPAVFRHPATSSEQLFSFTIVAIVRLSVLCNR